MRILAIRGANLASLARPFCIDLAAGPLAGVGLFAITGPVGAGKSTLLDALCLPLFDRTPRLSGRGGVLVAEVDGRDDDALRSNDPRTLLRRDAPEGHAEVDFVGRDGVRYRARWHVRRARRRLDGRVQEQELTLTDLDHDTVVAGRKTEVLAAIEQRLGLDFQQFCRSVLLAQGEFAAFLRASPDERARLLENLTGADLYRRLSRAAHERRKARQAAVDKLAVQFDGAKVLEGEQRAALDGKGRDLAAALRLHDVAVDLAQRYVTWFHAAARLRSEESEATVMLQRALDAQTAAGPRRERLQRLTIALPLVSRAEQVVEWQRRLAVATGDVAEAKKVQVEADAVVAGRAATLQRELADVLQAAMPEVPPLVADFALWQGPLERWVRGQARATATAAQVPEALRRAASAAAAVPPEQQRVVAAERAWQTAATALEAARQAVAAPAFALLPTARRQLAVDHGTLRERLDGWQRWRRCADDAAGAAVALAQRTDERDRLAAALRSLTAQRQAAEQRAATLRVEHEALRVGLDAAALRHHLVEGQPCPLCGSLDHPAPARSDDVGFRRHAEALAAAEAARTAAGAAEAEGGARLAAATQAAASAADTAARADTLRATAESAWWAVAADLVGVEVAEFGARLAAQREELARREAAYEAASERQAACQVELDRARDGEHAAAAALRQARETLQRAVEAATSAARAAELAQSDAARAAAAVGDLAAELGAGLSGVADWATHLGELGERAVERCRKLAARHQELAQARVAAGRAAEAQQRAAFALDGVREELRLATAAFEAALAAAGVRAVEVREAAEFGAGPLAREVAQLRELDTAVERARAVVQERAKVRQAHETSGRPELDEADATAALMDARTARQRVDEELADVRTQQALDDLMRRQRDELAPQLRAAQAALEVWAALDDLIGSSHGDAFAVFAQGLTLDLLLAEANRRLAELARRYRLQKNSGGDLDFVVVDLDLGGTRRSLQTLSGGETFLVSLSLALALATLAAPRSRVETLFLDEGFGTLDAQNLEQALGALDSLQAAGCQVGVISHVDGIAERIGACVEVRPEGGGQSRVVVRA